jgi:hypothetical protein
MVIVIPDIHQCLHFAEKILQRHPHADRYIFLGDYFDCLEEIDNKNYFSMSNTCEWLNSQYRKLGPRATWLIGNHDLSYISTYIPLSARVDKRMAEFYACSGWTASKASVFNKYIDPEFVSSLQICAFSENFVCSHAGFHAYHFMPYLSEFENIKRIHEKWEQEKSFFSKEAYHWIGQVGKCRGGNYEIGSPVWLDWDHEFKPLHRVRQIVGHTDGNSVRSKIHQPEELDYCIDSHRSSYAVLFNGSVKFYSV